MLEIYEQIEEATAAIRATWNAQPHAGIILGTGLGRFADDVEVEATLDYEEIPHFPRSTVVTHRGRLVCGRLAGLPVMAMEGRFHLYEGYSPKQITLPVRVMKAMGASLLIVTQAAGAMNPQFALGDVMITEDHINLMGANPLIGVNDDRLGPRFPDMSRPYDPQLVDLGLQIAQREDVVAHQGVLVAVTGPNLETRAEYRFLRMIGADVVSMSTVPEVIVAAHCGLRVFALAAVTDMCLPDALEPVDLEKIIATAESAEPKLRKLIHGILAHEAANSVEE